MRSRPILGITSCAAGVGSVVFHGPMPTWAEWAHDLTVAMLLVGLLLESRPLLAGLAGVALGVGLAFFLEAAELITVILAAITAIAMAKTAQKPTVAPQTGRRETADIGIAPC